VARALTTRGRGEHAAQVDFEAFERAIRDVEKQLQGLDEIQTSAGTIESGAGKIKERARILRGHLVKAIERLDEGFAAARRELTGA